ncbi:MAG: 16S rRNA (guanine(966)-N(2))-methyltransferase RsmD [Clostridia bacterium]|nr:16S rRNA (guanine(966)-N(2))-methyltransferase RsmD [Clostridia bacterium]
MRVVAGKARGTQIKSIESNDTRPTKDMVKEALFSILYNKVEDSVFLDLFAGSGAIGIEALSRGAEKAYFSDKNLECIKVIKANIEKTHFEQESVVLNGDFKSIVEKLKNIKFDIIFIDPPYNKGLGVEAIELLSDNQMLSDDGIIVYETDEIEIVPDNIKEYERYNYKKYGRNILNFYRRKG